MVELKLGDKLLRVATSAINGRVLNVRAVEVREVTKSGYIFVTGIGDMDKYLAKDRDFPLSVWRPKAWGSAQIKVRLHADTPANRRKFPITKR